MAHQHRHFAGDRFAMDGFWSPPTSAANFCEEDYAVTCYIAEFINSLSSLSYAYLALRLPPKHHGPQSVLCDPLSISLFLVGIASTVYHATLRQGPQFADEISMLFLGASLSHKVFSHGKSPETSKSIAACVGVGTLSVSIGYIQYGKILHHFLAFSTMVALVGFRTLYLILLTGRTQENRRMLMARFWKATAFLVVAFVVWNIDLEMCLWLRGIRRKVGLPWAWVLELHGWWHILTAIGAAEFILVVNAL